MKKYLFSKNKFSELVFNSKMIRPSLFIILVAFCFILTMSRRNHQLEPYFIYKSVKCTSSNITLSGFKCFVKAYSRTNATLNIFVNISKPVFKAYVTYDHRYKSLSNSQRSIINSTSEVCSILNGTENNIVFKWIIEQIPILGSILHPCPYQVRFREFG